MHCHPAAGAGTGFKRLSGRSFIAPSGGWDSGNQAFAISRGSSRHTAPYAWARLPVSWHAVFPGHPFEAGSAIRSKDISSRLCPLNGRYNSTPHGAPMLETCGSAGKGRM